MIGLRTVIKTGICAAAAAAGAAVYMGALDNLHLPQYGVLQCGGQSRIRVACVGDSITYGCFVAGQPWNSYPRVLGRLLGKDYCVGNFGYTNRTAINSADYPYTAEKLYVDSLEFRPDIVLILLGGNDTKEINWNSEKFRQDLGSLIESYRNLSTHPEVYLLMPTPAFPFRGKVMWDIRSDVLEEELIPACRQVAEEKGVTLIDTHDVLAGRKELFIDGCHPNRKGARLLAETVYTALIAHSREAEL